MKQIKETEVTTIFLAGRTMKMCMVMEKAYVIYKSSYLFPYGKKVY